MSTPHGLISAWQQGDWVTKFVFLLLLAMSLASWIVIVLKTLDAMRFKRGAAQVDAFWHSADMAQGLSRLGDADSPFHQLAESGQQAAAHVQQRHSDSAAHELLEQLDVSDWITRGLQNRIDAITARLQSGLTVLASVGSTAPFVGLFGTVWGIYHALLAIGTSGQVGIDQVAGPIGESLIMTALGLAVAIPAVLGYNALVRANKNTLARLNRFAHDLHAFFMTGARVGARDAACTKG